MVRRILLSLIAVLPLAASDEAFIAALARAPELLAAEAEVMAARHAVGGAGRLPDPMLTAGVARTRMPEAMRKDMVEIMLEQPLPRLGERDAMRAMAGVEVAMALAERRRMAGDLAAEIAEDLAMAEAARARAAQAAQAATRAAAASAMLAVRAAAGTAPLPAVLALDARCARLALDRTAAEREAADREDQVRARLGLAADAVLPPFAAPAAVRRERLPEVAAAGARSALARAQAAAADATRWPETAVGVRVARERNPNGEENTIGLTLRVGLPVWNAAAAGEAAAAARLRAALHGRRAGELRAQAAEARAARAAAQAAEAAAQAEASRRRLEAELAVQRTASAAGGADAAMLLDALDRLAEAELDAVMAAAAARTAAAALWRLDPPDLPLETDR